MRVYPFFVVMPNVFIAHFGEWREADYEGLPAVSRDDAWTGRCRFFVATVRAQAEDNLARARAILNLNEDMEHRLAEMTRSQHAIHAPDWIFERPIFKSTDFIARAGLSASTAKRVLGVLRQEGIVKAVSEGRHFSS